MRVSNASTITAPTRNYAIDALRFVAICFVIYIHIFAINPGVVFSNGTSWKVIDTLFGFARLAVPVFFAISGWFIFSRNRDDQLARLRKQIPKLLKIFIVGTVGTSIALWVLFKLHVPIPFDYFPTVRDLFNMFALGNSPTIAPLWFLVSLIIIELVYLVVTRICKKDNWLMVVALLFFALTILFGAYRPVIGLPALPFSINETWFVAFVWFSLGYFLAKFFKDSPAMIPSKTVLSFAITAGLLYFYEYILHTSGAPFVFGPYNYDAIFLFTPFATAGILLLAARSNNTHPIMQLLAYLGRNYALGVFIIHLVVMQPINAVFIKFGLLDADPLFKLVVTYSSTVVLSFGLTALYYKVKTALVDFTSEVPLNKL